MLNYSIVVKSQIGHRANGTTSSETHTRNTHVHRAGRLTMTGLYLLSFLWLAEGKRERK